MTFRLATLSAASIAAIGFAGVAELVDATDLG